MTAEHGEGVTPQVFWLPPTQVPVPSQTSPMLQNWPSSHELPFGAGTTTQVFSGPISCPVLHTATVHCGVSNDSQSTPQGPRSFPPVPLLLLLLLTLLSLTGSWPPGPQEHPTCHTTGSKSPTRRKSLIQPTIKPHRPCSTPQAHLERRSPCHKCAGRAAR